MKFRVGKERVLVAPECAPKKTEGGIFIPDNCNTQGVQRALVIAAGAESEWSEGDTVLVWTLAMGKIVEYGGERYLLFDDREVIAAIEEEEK